MMIGEITRSNPTLQVPPWDPYEDPVAASFSIQFDGNATSPADYSHSPTLFFDSVTSLHRYLPSNEFARSTPDFDSLSEDSSDVPVDAFSCDQFRIYEFKVRRCARGRSHDWTECPYAHPGEKAQRRDPRKYHYSGTACPEFRKGSCRKGDSCEFAHGVFECWLHPARYRTQPCKDGTSCRRRICFFAHTPEQLRFLPQQSPRGNGSCPGELEFGSSVRHRYDLTKGAVGSFVSSPKSILMSPPMSPPSDSPPASPCGGDLGCGSLNSVSELVSSMRCLQLGKGKMGGGSWCPQMGSGFGSPRTSSIRHGFCTGSVPSIPTRAQTRSGLSKLELWESSFEEEPAMERVESGKELRAKIYAKLSKENSVGGADPATSGPDIGWVSELVI